MNKLAALAVLATLAAVSAANSGDTCNAHVNEKCNEVGQDWTQGTCNSIFGGIRGNANNLHHLMQTHFEDSFKLLLTVIEPNFHLQFCRNHHLRRLS